jgi:hypothetical protein
MLHHAIGAPRSNGLARTAHTLCRFRRHVIGRARAPSVGGDHVLAFVREQVGHSGAVEHQPIEPSIWRVMSRFSSTAYSIGSSLVNASKKPLTMSALASVSVRPRLCK